MATDNTILLREDGLREGCQMHPHFVPTEAKLGLILELCDAGISQLEVTSFVRHDRVPQLADAAELVSKLPLTKATRFTALYLNLRGLELACAFPALRQEGLLLLAVSDTFLRKNTGRSLVQTLSAVPSWIKAFARHKLGFDRIMLSTAFGCVFEGLSSAEAALDVLGRALEESNRAGMHPQEITLADTNGFATPHDISKLVKGCQRNWPEIEIGLHLHDTRAMGLANVYEGLNCGVRRFDCSIAGVGGCPFTAGAAGNVATEEVVYLCEQQGFKTGIDMDKIISCARSAASLFAGSEHCRLAIAGLPPISKA